MAQVAWSNSGDWGGDQKQSLRNDLNGGQKWFRVVLQRGLDWELIAITSNMGMRLSCNHTVALV